MAETLRDLVVSLSLQTDNFTRNVRSVNKQIQEAESFFKAASAGVENFERTTQGLSTQLSTLQQKLTLQNQVVEQYQRALEAARAKLTECYTRQADYSQRLEEAKSIQVQLRTEVTSAAEAYQDCATRLGASDTATLAAAQNLESLKNQYRDASAEVQKLAGQCEALRKSTLNAADAVSTGNVNLNRATAAVKTTEADITKCNQALALAKTDWTAAGESMQASQAAIASIGLQMSRADAQFRLATVGIKDTAGSTEYLSAQADQLNTRYELQNQALTQYRNALAAANQQLEAAKQVNDPALIQQATDAVTRAETELYNASAALKQTEQDIAANQQELTLASNGWYTAAESIRNSQTAIAGIGNQMRLAQSEFQLAAAGVQNFDTTVNGLSARLTMLETQLQLQNNAVREYQNILAGAQTQLAAAQSAGDPTKIEQATQAVTQAQTALNQAQAAVRTTTAEIANCNNELTLANNGWYTAAEAIQNSNAAIASIGNQIQLAESNFAKATSTITSIETSVDGLSAKLTMLQEKWQLQQQVVTQCEAALQAAQQQLTAATAAGDAGKIQQATNAVTQAQTALNNASAAVGRTDQEIQRCTADLTLAQSGWHEATAALTAAQTGVTSVGKSIQEADSRVRLATAGVTNLERNTTALGDKLAALNDKYQLQQQAVERYAQALEAAKAQLQAAQAANDPAKIQEATNAVTDAQTALNQAQAAVRETRQEIDETTRALHTASSGWTRFGDAMQHASTQLEGMGKTATRLGKTLSMVATTPIAALGTTAIKASIDFESGFTGVRKTVEATEEQFQQLSDSVKEMSTQVAASTEEISEVMATGGQLGIATENLEEFTKVMIDLGNCCEDLNANDAATALAKFANIMGTNQEDFDRIGSTVVDLGNNYATTEKAIMEMAKRLAGAGKQVGLTEAQILGFATALSSVGIEAQMGGSAFSKALVNMEVAVATGGQSLEDFAMICGMTTDQFKQMWEADPAAVFQSFILGLAQLDEEGESTIAVLQDIGIKEIRLRDTMLRAVNATELFTNAQETANRAWEENTALTNEANKRYATTESQLKNLENKAKLFAQQLGDDLNPMIGEMTSGIGDLIDKVMEMDSSQRQQLIRIAAIVAAAGPVLLIFGKLSTTLGKVSAAIGKFAHAVGEAGGGVTGLVNTIMSSPAAVAALTAAIAFGTYKLYDYASGAHAAREALEGMTETAEKWKNTSAETFYGTSGGLSEFGMSKGDFQNNITNSQDWVDGIIQVWTDGEKESDEIVNQWTDSFKGLTEDTRTQLKQLKGVADASGYTSVSGQLEKDIQSLDDMDEEITNLIKKRQNGYFSDEDKVRLQELIDDREALIIKYKLEPEGENEGFETIQEKVQAEVARAHARGQEDADVSVYQNAMVAAAEGLAAVNEQIDAEYDEQYALIQLMDDGAEKTAAMNQLNEQYNADRLAAAREYAQTLASVVMPVWNQEDIQGAGKAVDDLSAAMQRYSIAQQNNDTEGMNAALAEMENLTANMDEGALTEYYGMLTQIQSLLDSGMSTEEVQALFPEIDFTSQLNQLSTLTSFIEEHKGTLSGLSTMFGEALPEEVEMITVDLDMGPAQTRWSEFAQNPGSITTDAVIQSYSEAQGVIKNGPHVDAFIDSYTEVAEGASTASLTPKGLIAYVTTYAEATTGADVSGLTPDNITAMVAAYKELAAGTDVSALTPDDITAHISKYLEDNGVDTSGLTPDAITAFVVAYEEATGGATTAALTPTDIAAMVTKYMEAEGVDITALTGAQVDGIVNAYAEATSCDKSALKAEVNAQITAYKLAKGITTPKPKGYISIVGYDKATYDSFIQNNPVEVQGHVRLGEVYENPEDVLNAPNAQFYDENGQSIEVNFVPKEKLTADTLIAYDTDGTLHVLLSPEIQGTTESVTEAGQKLTEKSVNTGGGILPAGQKDVAWLNGLIGTDTLTKIDQLNVRMQKLKESKDGLFSKGSIKTMDSDLSYFMSGDTLSGLTTYVSEMVAAIQNGEEVSEEDLAHLQSIIDFVNNMDALNIGQDVKADIAQGMSEAGWDTDAASVATNLQTALDTAMGTGMEETGEQTAAGIGTGMSTHDFSGDAETTASGLETSVNTALGVQSPSTRMIPTGENVAAGIGQGMIQHSFAGEVGTVASGIISAANSRLHISTLYNVGKNVMAGLASGILAGCSSVVSAMASAASSALAAAKNALGIASPSTVFRDEVGAMAMRGFGEGALRESKAQAKIIRNAMNYITDAAQESVMSRGVSDNRRTYNNQSSVNLTGNNFYVSDEQDAKELAIEISTLTRRQQRGYGMRR